MIEPEPRQQPGAAEQREMRDPHRNQDRAAGKPKLDRDGEELIVRIDRRDGGRPALSFGRATEQFRASSRCHVR